MGPNGRRLCRWCWDEVPARRSSWCSDACVEEFRLHHDWNYIRRAVERRDGGVCVLCETDTAFLADALWHRQRSIGASGHRDPLSLRLLDCDGTRSPWEADHVHARSEGGSDHPSNLRTLCLPCHKRRTAEQRTRWAAAKRDEKAALFAGVA